MRDLVLQILGVCVPSYPWLLPLTADVQTQKTIIIAIPTDGKSFQGILDPPPRFVLKFSPLPLLGDRHLRRMTFIYKFSTPLGKYPKGCKFLSIWSLLSFVRNHHLPKRLYHLHAVGFLNSAILYRKQSFCMLHTEWFHLYHILRKVKTMETGKVSIVARGTDE